ncbi:DUF4174 domain-containing protein [Aquimarina celericrescens]|uniref:DUF4174 domain-containing protein n=1 Tax=Aquimarina celericrescens TaxID=1964542 RepID=A0ABW5ATF9_9FLAO|nr:DUF4174 domain-containing protein [Aquimarina celericrescens]
MRKFLYFCFLGFYAMSWSQDFKEHQWKNRIIIICTDSFSNPEFQKQKSELNKYPNELKDRKLIVYKVTPDNYRFGLGSTISLRTDKQFFDTFNNEKSQFKIILIGLDGSIKMTWENFIAPTDIFALIDQMPMRKNEIKN